MPQLYLSLIPALVYLAIFLFLGNISSFKNVRQLILRAALLWGLYLVALMEGLSPLHRVTQTALVIAWLLPILGFGVLAWQRKRRGYPFHLPKVTFPKTWDTWIAALLTLGVLIATFLVAWFSPPQTWDSLTYHLARVAHWAQNASIWPYASGIERQNSMPPGAELITLNNYVLIQGDQLASLTQWFAMLGSLIGISLITARLGARAMGQWVAVLAAVTLPIGLIEASSTINDYVATFWSVVCIAEVMDYYQQGQNKALVYMAAAAGLALYTKPTVAPYLAFFGLWVASIALKKMGWIQSLKWGALAVGVVITICSGYLIRNLITFGSPLNPTDVALQANQLHTPKALISNLLKYTGVHAGFPNADAWNHWVYLTIVKINIKLGMDIQDPRLTEVGYFAVKSPSTADDFGTNPYHAALFLLSTVLLMAYWAWKKRGGLSVGYAAVVIMGFVGYCYLYKWQVFALRLETVFFVIFCPVVGYTLGLFENIDLLKGQGRLVGLLVGASLVYLSLPWILRIDSRPLIPTSANPGVPSVLTTPRSRLYYGTAPGFASTVQALTEPIKQHDCNQVGMMLLGDDPEYFFWVALGAPRKDLTIDWIVAGTPSAKYRLPGFKPCAIITDGQNSATMDNLPLAVQSGGYRLYLNPR